jgi:REP element-mobilizing transposase RayT
MRTGKAESGKQKAKIRDAELPMRKGKCWECGVFRQVRSVCGCAPSARTKYARVIDNSNGIESFSPALTRQRLRWVRVQNQSSTLKELNPSGVSRILTTMPQSLAKILVHAVFSTKEHRPLLRDKILRDELHRYLGGILNRLDCQPITVGGVEDHVHFLCALSRTSTAAEMVKETKRGSSLWLKTKGPDLCDFAWQNGYGIFSVGFRKLKR